MSKINSVLFNVDQTPDVGSTEMARARDNIGAQAKLTPGDNISITNQNVISASVPDVSGLATKSELTTGLAAKQDTLTAGTGISILNNVISATGSGVSMTGWGGYRCTVTKVLNGTGTQLWVPGSSDFDFTLTHDYVNCTASTSAVSMYMESSTSSKLRVNIKSWAPAVLPCHSAVYVDENANFGNEMASWGHPYGGYCQVCSGMSRIWLVEDFGYVDENGVQSLTQTLKSGTMRVVFTFWFPLGGS